MSIPDQPNHQRHAALKATWKPGQRWETMVVDKIPEHMRQWVPVGEGGLAEPLWDGRQEYRCVDGGNAALDFNPLAHEQTK